MISDRIRIVRNASGPDIPDSPSDIRSIRALCKSAGFRMFGLRIEI